MRLFFFVIFLSSLLSESCWGKTVIVPKRETAKSYFLLLTNISTGHKIEIESKNGKFNLPDSLDGEFSIQVTFLDKWGRRIEGQGPKIIKIISQLPRSENKPIATKQSSSFFGIIFNAYQANGQYEADLSGNTSGLNKVKETLSAIGIKTILSVQSYPKYLIGLERQQGTSANAKINFTEFSISYDLFGFTSRVENFKTTSGIAFNSAELKGEFKDGEDTITPNIQASSGYIYGTASYVKNFETISARSEALIGASFNYFRYGLSQSVSYEFNQNFSMGPWGQYAKFENGNSSGSIKSNLLSLGILLNFNL